MTQYQHSANEFSNNEESLENAIVRFTSSYKNKISEIDNRIKLLDDSISTLRVEKKSPVKDIENVDKKNTKSNVIKRFFGKAISATKKTKTKILAGTKKIKTVLSNSTVLLTNIIKKEKRERPYFESLDESLKLIEKRESDNTEDLEHINKNLKKLKKTLLWAIRKEKALFVFDMIFGTLTKTITATVDMIAKITGGFFKVIDRVVEYLSKGVVLSGIVGTVAGATGALPIALGAAAIASLLALVHVFRSTKRPRGRNEIGERLPFSGLFGEVEKRVADTPSIKNTQELPFRVFDDKGTKRVAEKSVKQAAFDLTKDVLSDEDRATAVSYFKKMTKDFTVQDPTSFKRSDYTAEYIKSLGENGKYVDVSTHAKDFQGMFDLLLSSMVSIRKKLKNKEELTEEEKELWKKINPENPVAYLSVPNNRTENLAFTQNPEQQKPINANPPASDGNNEVTSDNIGTPYIATNGTPNIYPFIGDFKWLETQADTTGSFTVPSIKPAYT